ncbi:MAG TPA: acetylxylan esterase [Thermoclostridium caenicola]|uniref:Cephalosporin-C deacetylase n=1 Tax=Thermoclostridium caenicola TaxID=659425 RepID=A0A1M6JKM5_9FIRM|nr:acetylxylan esterase [Thermoclostridium caenicola]SHJ47233.1 cephalosporin-C deacetylase [Thermoclostridium caenicola]HOK43560.1 acetylxylan esterase [Thermoclostridium caenicola]HOL84569.1 acetylxylan esterase [Thermoclostridium caenicola]HOP71840.1 acetylxylan esterase [Thermoclostridium caenicola]HPO76460.1 acetylxylan esterase [Thermoclostridium caenicola]
MPMVDMPLAELKQYTGINPRPDNFDAFWDEALEEMRRTPHRTELIPAKFQADFAECFDLYFDGTGGSRIHAKYLRPANRKGKCPVILQFHGYSADSGDWVEKLGYVAAGFCVAALDCRGQGGLSEDLGPTRGTTYKCHFIKGLDGDPKDLFYRHMFLDTAKLADIVLGFSEVDENRAGATGASQGGALTVACAALEPRIKKLAPVYPFLSDYKRVWEMDLAKDAYEELRYYFRRFDPLHEREDEIFTRLGYIDIQHLAPRIRGETLWAVGLMDTVCPPSTQFAAYNKIPGKKEMLIYPDYGHEHIKGLADKIFTFFMGLSDR